jgi:glutamyl-tRNA reductase
MKSAFAASAGRTAPTRPVSSAAAVATLAATHLARSQVENITVVGCGEQGEAQLRAMAEVRPLRRGFVLDADVATARALARRMSDELSWPIESITDLDAAVAASDICVTCTTSERPLLYREHLHPDCSWPRSAPTIPGNRKSTPARWRTAAWSSTRSPRARPAAISTTRSGRG